MGLETRDYISRNDDEIEPRTIEKFYSFEVLLVYSLNILILLVTTLYISYILCGSGAGKLMQFQFKDPTLLHIKFLNLNNREAA